MTRAAILLLFFGWFIQGYSQQDTVAWGKYVRALVTHELNDSVIYQSFDTLGGEEVYMVFQKRKKQPEASMLGRTIGDTVSILMPVNYYYPRILGVDRPSEISGKNSIKIQYVVKDILTAEEKQKEKEVLSNNSSQIAQLKLDSLLRGNPNCDTIQHGLYIKMIEHGSSEKTVAKNRKVVVAYKGTIFNGIVFDENDGFTFVFGKMGLIEAWEIALNGKQEGDEFILICHPDLAYGSKDIPNPVIGPNEPLYFKIKIEKVI